MKNAPSPNTVRIAKRLTQATGYIELGMMPQALDHLDRAAGLAEADGLTPLLAVVTMLRGVATRAAGRREDATVALAEAAESLPDRASQSAWLALSACYRHAGEPAAAANSLAHVRGAQPAK